MAAERAGGRATRSVLLALGLVALLPGRAWGHEHREVGNLGLTVGWAEEPALAEVKNGVELFVARGEREVEGGRLEVVVIFGQPDADIRTQPMPLDPAFGEPGRYAADLIPTRPGTYTFHMTGRIGGESLDELFTSGPETFHDVNNPAEVEFPVQDPTRAELATRLDRLDARIAEAPQGDGLARGRVRPRSHAPGGSGPAPRPH
jgi:hypothetical protein